MISDLLTHSGRARNFHLGGL